MWKKVEEAEDEQEECKSSLVVDWHDTSVLVFSATVLPGENSSTHLDLLALKTCDK